MAGEDTLGGGLGTDRQRGGTGAWILLGGDDRIVLKGIDHTVLERTDFEFVSRCSSDVLYRLMPHSISRFPAKPGRRSRSNPAATRLRRTKPAAA